MGVSSFCRRCCFQAQQHDLHESGEEEKSQGNLYALCRNNAVSPARYRALEGRKKESKMPGSERASEALTREIPQRFLRCCFAMRATNPYCCRVYGMHERKIRDISGKDITCASVHAQKRKTFAQPGCKWRGLLFHYDLKGPSCYCSPVGTVNKCDFL